MERVHTHLSAVFTDSGSVGGIMKHTAGALSLCPAASFTSHLAPLFRRSVYLSPRRMGPCQRPEVLSRYLLTLRTTWGEQPHRTDWNIWSNITSSSNRSMDSPRMTETAVDLTPCDLTDGTDGSPLKQVFVCTTAGFCCCCSRTKETFMEPLSGSKVWNILSNKTASNWTLNLNKLL